MDDDQTIERYLDAASQVAGVPIPPAARPGVVQFFKLAASLAAQVAAFDLPDEAEPAPVYRPGQLP